MVVKRVKKKPKSKAAPAPEVAAEEPASNEQAETTEGHEAERVTTLAEEEEAKLDRRGIVHLPDLPLAMHPQKLRHIMEQFGEVGRIFLSPEDPLNRKHRKRQGGNKKKRYTEGWVEFTDKKVAKRVAASLNGNTVGGRKRHNFYRDRVWNVRYLPKFKWHMLHEGERYNKQVRKARLKQQINQARRETDYFLENVHKAKVQKRRAAQDFQQDAVPRPEREKGVGRPAKEWKPAKTRQPSSRETTRDISDKLLSALF
mmetsp:Transcript_23701/g.55272  ORF Transcript_23701/g.55272 Transcript_23701/m.55272 type:complete len:257 (-) Transcript_23701:48-818(-)